MQVVCHMVEKSCSVCLRKFLMCSNNVWFGQMILLLGLFIIEDAVEIMSLEIL